MYCQCLSYKPKYEPKYIPFCVLKKQCQVIRKTCRIAASTAAAPTAMNEADDEIIELTFPSAVTATTQIRKLLATIEHYRSKGRSLREIHRALVDNGHLEGCGWATFEKSYYRVRKQTE